MAHLRRRGEACQTTPDITDQSCSWCSTGGGTGPSARAMRSRWRTRPPGPRLWNGHPRTLLDASGLAVGLPSGQMGNSEVGPPQPRCRARGAAGPRAHLPEHRAGRVLPAAGAAGARRLAPADAAARCTSSGCSVPAACTPSTGTCSPASSWACGSRCRRSPFTASSTAATPRPRSAPRWCGRCCSTCAAIAGSRVDVASLTGPLLRHGPRQALGSHPCGVRRHRPRHRHRRASIPCSRCRPPTSGAKPTSSSGRSCITATGCRSPRSRTATASSSSTTGATGCARSSPRFGVEGFSGFDTGRRPGGALRHHDAVRPDLSHSPGLSAVHAGAHPRRGAGRQRAHPASHRRDGEVSARHLLLQRRVRAALQGRGAPAGASHPGSRPTTWRPR